MKLKLILLCCCMSMGLHSQQLLPGLEFGMGKSDVNYELKDVSNPESWEESTFEVQEKVTFKDLNPSRVQLLFYKNRLCEIKLTFMEDLHLELLPELDQLYGQKAQIDSNASAISASWDSGKKHAYMLSSASETSIFFSDDEAREFHFGDLFQGILLYIILAIVGLFTALWCLTWLATAHCDSCKSYAMKYVKVSRDNPQDYSRSMNPLERADIHYDTVYTFKCSKCGHTRQDRYSSYWSWYRKNKR